MSLRGVAMTTVLLVLLMVHALAKNEHAPNVQIYTRDPGRVGVENVLICHAKGFHPPELELELFVDGETLRANQTELAFEETWYYHLTTHAHFRPRKDRTYSCRVTHLGREKSYVWEPDM